MIQDSEGRLKEQVGTLTSQLETENRDRETECEAWKENIRVLQEQIEGKESLYTIIDKIEAMKGISLVNLVLSFYLLLFLISYF